MSPISAWKPWSLSAVMSVIGGAIANLVNYSMHVNRWSKLLERGKGPTKLIYTWMKRTFQCGKTLVGECVRRLTFDCWHAEHSLNHLCTSFCEFGCTYLAFISITEAFAPEWDKEWKLLSISFGYFWGRNVAALSWSCHSAVIYFYEEKATGVIKTFIIITNYTSDCFTVPLCLIVLKTDYSHCL